MFTGLIETQGKILSCNLTSLGARFSICAEFSDNTLKIGDSVCVNGACHTVISINDNVFEVETMNETLSKTNFSKLKVGSIVNLERSLALNSRLDGHFVTGHIDGVGKLISIKKDGFSNVYRIEFDTKYIIQKGSVALNGVSLTVSAVDKNYFEVSLIPHTLNETNLKDSKVGDLINIELDILSKYIEKLLSLRDNDTKISVDFLKENGFNV